MGGGKGDVGRGGVAVRRDASWVVEIEEREVATFHGVDKQFASGVVRGRKPADAVGVKVAHNNSIAVGMVEERKKVWSVVGGARRGRRNVNVVYEQGEMTKMNVDGDGFQVEIGVEKVRHVDRSILNVMADENGDTTSSAILAITSEKSKARERWVRIARAQLSLLEARNLDIVFAQVRREFLLRRVQPVYVEL